MRIAVACALIGALIGAGVALAREREYPARAFVIRVPPLDGRNSVLALTRRDSVMRGGLSPAADRLPGG